MRGGLGAFGSVAAEIAFIKLALLILLFDDDEEEDEDDDDDDEEEDDEEEEAGGDNKCKFTMPAAGLALLLFKGEPSGVDCDLLIEMGD